MRARRLVLTKESKHLSRAKDAAGLLKRAPKNQTHSLPREWLARARPFTPFFGLPRSCCKRAPLDPVRPARERNPFTDPSARAPDSLNKRVKAYRSCRESFFRRIISLFLSLSPSLVASRGAARFRKRRDDALCSVSRGSYPASGPCRICTRARPGP